MPTKPIILVLLLLLISLLIFAPAVYATGQAKPVPVPQRLVEMKQAEQARELLGELARSEYRARMDIPAIDCIFVEDGKIAESMYRAALREQPKALPAGAVTKVSSVKVMDRAIQVFFATDSCALIAVSSGSAETAAMSAKDLIEMARKAIAPLFETMAPAKAEKQKSAETKPDPEKKN